MDLCSTFYNYLLYVKENSGTVRRTQLERWTLAPTLGAKRTERKSERDEEAAPALKLYLYYSL